MMVKKTTTTIAAGALAAITAAMLTAAPAQAAAAGGDDKVHLLTTGTSVVFETNGQWVLVGGDQAAYQYLTSRGVTKLAAYVAVNANPDVIAAAPDIIGAFKPGSVWAPGYDESRVSNPTAVPTPRTVASRTRRWQQTAPTGRKPCGALMAAHSLLSATFGSRSTSLTMRRRRRPGEPGTW